MPSPSRISTNAAASSSMPANSTVGSPSSDRSARSSRSNSRASPKGPLASLSRSHSEDNTISSISANVHAGNPVINAASHNELADTNSGKPYSYSGSVIKKDGKLTSSNGVINAVLNYSGAKDAESPINRLAVGNRASLSLTLPANINDRTDEFSDAVGEAAIPVLQQVIVHGGAGLDESLRNRLAAAAPTVSSNHPALSEFIKRQLHTNPDLQIRLGAEAMLQASTEKQFDLKGLGLSILVSAGIGSAWELGLSHVIKKAAFGSDFSPSKIGLKLAGIDSVPPLVIETLDTLCVLMIMQTMGRKRTAQATNEEGETLRDKLPKALTAGVTSAVLSFPNNVMEYKGTGNKWGDIALNAATTDVAIWSAASGVPLEVKEDEEKLEQAVREQILSGLMAPPPEGQTLDQHVHGIVSRAMAISPKDGIAQKSMGFATIVGLMPLVLSNKVTNTLSDPVLRIMRSTVFNPIEAISLNVLAATAKLGIPWMMTSDNQKHAQAVQLVLENAHAADGESGTGHVDQISPEQLHRILAPRREFLRHTGEGVIWAMNGMFHGLTALADSVNKGARWAVGAGHRG